MNVDGVIDGEKDSLTLLAREINSISNMRRYDATLYEWRDIYEQIKQSYQNVYDMIEK